MSREAMSVAAVQTAADQRASGPKPVLTPELKQAPDALSAAYYDASPENDQKSRGLQLRRELMRALLGVVLIALLRTLLQLGGEEYQSLSYVLALITIHISIIAFAFGAFSLIVDVAGELRRGIFSTSACELLALILLLGTSIFALFAEIEKLIALPLLSTVPAVVALVAGVRLLEHHTHARIARRRPVPLEEAAREVRLSTPEDPSAEKQIPSRLAQPGDIFVVRAGEIIPLDAHIESGKAKVHERRFGGREVTRYKSPGQTVFAGTVLERGELVCRSTARQEDAMYGGFLATILGEVGEVRAASIAPQVGRGTALLLVFTAACTALFWQERGAAVLNLGLAAAAVLLCGLFPRSWQLLAEIRPLAFCNLFLKGITLKSPQVLKRLSTLRNLVFDYESLAKSSDVEILRFEVLDERVDERSLVGVLLAMLGDADDEFSSAALKVLDQRLKDPLLFELKDYHYYEDKGILATIQGTEFSLGNEEFLIERGVELQPSDLAVLNDGEDVVYVAMREEVVARFILAPASRKNARAAIRGLAKLGVRPLLCGPEPSAEVDGLAKELQIPLSNSYGALSGEAYREKLEDWKPVGAYALVPPTAALAKLVDLSVSHFDELRWNERETDVTLYDRDLGLLTTACRLCRRSEGLYRFSLSAAVCLSAALLVAAFLAVASPSAVVAVVVIAYTLLSLAVHLSLE